MTFVADLEPSAVWRHFDRILEIPRPSKGEEAMRRYVRERAAARPGTETRVDDAGNLVVTVPATPGCPGLEDGAEPVVLQSHLDMVQEKNVSPNSGDSDFDFATDAIRPQRDGDYLLADGTTLGADNGLGVAAMLAVLDGADDLRHGPLELLFTIDEETGLTGAAELSPDLLQGRRLLNLDTEEEGALYVGCAGGGDSLLRLPVTGERTGESQDGDELRVALTGLKGGHSGVDIHLQRGNALRLLARVVRAAADDGAVPIHLLALHGGTAHNAIPREAFADLRVPAGMADEATAALDRAFTAVRDEYRSADPGMSLAVEPRRGTARQSDTGDIDSDALDSESGDRLLALLVALPHGVAAMSHDIPDLVETSSNLARVARRDDVVEVLMSTRSSVATALEAQRDRVRALAELAGAEVEEEEAYPGWQPDMDSPLLATLRRLHNEVLGEDPEIKAIHAGLETGIIGEKYPGMDMISFGPRIEYPHSPDERAYIPSVAPFWELLKAALAELGCRE